MSQAILDFMLKYYKKGRIVLIGCNDVAGKLIRNSEKYLTNDQKPSLWSHIFIMGDIRDDGRDDGSIYIYESDLTVNAEDLTVYNRAIESRLVKWCSDSTIHACVIDTKLNSDNADNVVLTAFNYAYHYRNALCSNPVTKLFDSSWNNIFNSKSRNNIFNITYAMQCASFVRKCIIEGSKSLVDIDSKSVILIESTPETIYHYCRYHRFIVDEIHL